MYRSNLRTIGVVNTCVVVEEAVVWAFGFALCGVSGQLMPLRNLKSSMAMSPVKLVPLTPSAIICYIQIKIIISYYLRLMSFKIILKIYNYF